MLLRAYSVLFVALLIPLYGESLQEQAESYHKKWQEPAEGIIFAECDGGKVDFGAAGKTSHKGKVPAPNTLFEIGSITKVFTGILLAEAVREGKVKLNDPVAKHLPDVDLSKSSPFFTITLEQLSTHTSGLPRLPLDLERGADTNNPYAHYDKKRLLNGLKKFDGNGLEQPGKRSYSNYAVGILGFILEEVYEIPYAELIKTKITDPLQMNDTVVLNTIKKLPPNLKSRLAKGHNGGEQVKHWELSSLAAAGGILSTAEDLIKFAQAHWSRDTPTTLAKSMQIASEPRIKGQGLGWMISGDQIRHNGGTGGFSTDLTVVTSKKTARIELRNSSGQSYSETIEGDFTQVSGYWEGALKVRENKKLRLILFIKPNGNSYIHSIDQRGFLTKASKAIKEGDEFTFSFPQIKSVFSGKLQNGDLNGAWEQNGKTPLTFKKCDGIPEFIKKSTKDKKSNPELARLEGFWSGHIGGGTGLFVYIEVDNAGNQYINNLYSPDQHNAPITIDEISIQDNTFTAKIKAIKGIYTGKLSKKGDKITGIWNQGFPQKLELEYSEKRPNRKSSK